MICRNMENAQKIQHLYARAGFGLSPTEWNRRREQSLNEALQDLFSKPNDVRELPVPALVISETTANNNGVQQKERQLVAAIGIDWLNRMAAPLEDALLERMCLFWHGHFACDIRIGLPAGQYLNTLRRHALGNFRDLVTAIAREPAMIRYLNNQQNRKERPNENFARELMELFTIGRGHYSEQDVKEAARAFTGWSSDRTGQFIFRRLLHDFDSKIFMGRTGYFDGDDVIHILLEQKQTARFICQKIYRYFVNEQPDEQRVEAMTEVFFADYDIARLMRFVLESDWFYEDRHIGSKIKSHVELTAGILRQLGVRHCNPAALIGIHRAMGQVLFHPPNVAGWPGGKSWIDNSTLMMRLQLGAAFCMASDFDLALKTELDEQDRRFVRRLEAETDFAPLADLCKQVPEKEHFDVLSSFLLLPDVSRHRSTVEAYVPAGAPQERIRQLTARLMSLPEYQMC